MRRFQQVVKHRIWSRNRHFRNENTHLIWSPELGVQTKTQSGSKWCETLILPLFHKNLYKSLFLMHSIFDFGVDNRQLLQLHLTKLQIRSVKLTSINTTLVVSSPNPMFNHLLEFGEDISIIEMKICTLSDEYTLYLFFCILY